MLSKLYAKWMYAWETALTTRDTNRIVRPLEWGFDWLRDFSPLAAAHATGAPAADDYARMIAINADIVARAEEFFGYQNPTDFRLEARQPQPFPTNARTRPPPAPPRHPGNDPVNARWFPAPEHRYRNRTHPPSVISTGAVGAVEK